MKVLTVKSAVLFIILNLFAVIIFASELQFRIKVCKNMNQEQLNLYSPITFNNGCIEIGSFENYIHVMKAQIELKEKGVYTSEIIAFFNFLVYVSQRITPKGFFRYTLGEFKTLSDAKDVLRMVLDSGLDNAIIIAYAKLARIPLARAIEKEGQILENALAIQR